MRIPATFDFFYSIASMVLLSASSGCEQVLDQTVKRQYGTRDSLLHDPYPPKKSNGDSRDGTPGLWADSWLRKNSGMESPVEF